MEQQLCFFLRLQNSSILVRLIESLLSPYAATATALSKSGAHAARDVAAATQSLTGLCFSPLFLRSSLSIPLQERPLRTAYVLV